MRHAQVPVILAVGMALALNMLTATVMVVVLNPHLDQTPRAGEYLSNVLTGWGGGIIGVLGAFVGYYFGSRESS